MIRRAEACQLVVDRFHHQPLEWFDADCSRLVHELLLALGFKTPWAGVGRYTTEQGAAKALRRKGFETLAAAVDTLGFDRIAPAMAWPADILAFNSHGSQLFDIGLGVSLPRGHVLTMLDDERAGNAPQFVVLDSPADALFGWRVQV